MNSIEQILEILLDGLAALEPTEAVFMLDVHGRIRAWRTPGERVFWLKDEQVRGREYGVLFPPEDVDEAAPQRILAAAIREGRARHQGWLPRGDGSQFWGDMRIAVLAGTREPPLGLVVVVRDCTDVRELEKRVGRANALEAVLANSRRLVHDCNNFLMVATHLLAAMKRKIDPADPALCDLTDLDQALTRVGDVLRKCFAEGAYPAAPARVFIQLNDIATAVARMLHAVVGGDVQVRLRLDPSLESVEADPLGIEQVLVNLVLNAKQSMSVGGTITLKTATVDLRKKITRAGSEVAPGRYARLRVEDSGCGMTPAVVARVFDPPVTAKAPGQRTGLGLTSCLHIVRGHGGEMTIDSDPGRGTRVDVYLPCRHPIELERLPQALRNSTAQASGSRARPPSERHADRVERI